MIEKKVGWIIRFKKEMESSLFASSNVTTQILLNVIVLFSRFDPNSTYWNIKKERLVKRYTK